MEFLFIFWTESTDVRRMTFCAPHDSNCFVTFHPDDCSRCDMKKSVGRPVERIQLSSISIPFRQKKRKRLLRTWTFPSILSQQFLRNKKKEEMAGVRAVILWLFFGRKETLEPDFLTLVVACPAYKNRMLNTWLARTGFPLRHHVMAARATL